MHIITTHSNTDFDALASMVAGTYLYPDAFGVLPSHLQPNVRDFLAIHQDMFRIMPRKYIDLEDIRTLTIVDTNNWRRLDRMEGLKSDPDININLWDHHMEGGNVEPAWFRREEVGATVTMMLEEMKDRDCAFSPIHATLFLLGIYDDTGCLSFPSTTSRDAYVAGFLIENGADLNIVTSYLNTTVDDPHSEVFKKMLDSSKVVRTAGYNVGLCMLEVESGLTMLSSLVTKFREFKGYDAAFGIFSVGGKCMVIGRGGPQTVDVGSVVRKLGGGGHPGAGSATVRSTDISEVFEKVIDLVMQSESHNVLVEHIMSPIDPFTVSSSNSMENARRAFENKLVSALLVVDQGNLQGALSMVDFLKAEKGSMLNAPVKGFMRRDIPVLHPGQTARDVLSIMSASDIGVLPVMSGEKIQGVVTRADLLFQVYNF